MKINKLKTLISKSKELLPISFNEIVFKENIIKGNSKLVANSNYKDSVYSINSFYKSISRF
jgi:hypothetical protein